MAPVTELSVRVTRALVVCARYRRGQVEPGMVPALVGELEVLVRRLRDATAEKGVTMMLTDDEWIVVGHARAMLATSGLTAEVWTLTPEQALGIVTRYLRSIPSPVVLAADLSWREAAASLVTRLLGAGVRERAA